MIRALFVGDVGVVGDVADVNCMAAVLEASVSV
jgi:hypothetical protein